jgi:hypothetical protein
MHWLNWLIVGAWVTFVSVASLRRARGTTGIEATSWPAGACPGGQSALGDGDAALRGHDDRDHGAGATDGLRFIQFYFGLPIAMVILGVTLVPFLHNAKVYTAYEFLERRFDSKTRSLTSFLFLISRGCRAARSSVQPAIVFSAIFGWNLAACVALIGCPPSSTP